MPRPRHRSARLGLSLALAGCPAPGQAPQAVQRGRPSPKASVLDVFGDPEGHGVVFLGTSPAAKFADVSVLRESSGGERMWTHELPPAMGEVFIQEPALDLGGSYLLLTSTASEYPYDGAVHLRSDGTMHAWTSPSREAGFNAVHADATQVFVIWHALFPRTGVRSPLIVAAYDPASGQRTWTVEDRAPDWAYVDHHLDERWLLVGHDYADWQALRRTDGARVALPDVEGDLCRAAGRWWGAADDHLVALDLRGDTPARQTAPAAFVPPALVHQWTLTDCADSGDEVVLLVNLEPGDEGLVVGLDPASLAPRWSVPVAAHFSPLRDRTGVSLWSRPLGRTTVVRTTDGWCAVDLAQHSMSWCIEREAQTHTYIDGEDTILRIDPPHDDRDDLVFARVRATDGEFVAAARVRDSLRPGGRDQNGVSAIRGGRLWLTLDDLEPARRSELPLIVLDARTLAPIDPKAPGHVDATDFVSDGMADVVAAFARKPAPDPEAFVREPLQAADPWDHYFGATTPQPTPPADHHAAIFARAHTQAGLAADTKIDMLGWRGKLVVGYAEETRAGATTWTLVWGTDPEPLYVDTRTFTRRPTAGDIHRFILSRHPLGLWAFDSPKPQQPGGSDEQAWERLTGARRQPGAVLWQLRGVAPELDP